MIDIHCHILPNMDDGAKDLASALAMLQIASRCGINTIVATPHVIENCSISQWEDIVRACTALNVQAQNLGIDVCILPGAEVAIGFDILEVINGPGPFCLNQGSYMLVELPAAQIPRYTEEFFFKLQAKGITPILAHPERNTELSRYPELLTEWLGKGVLTQINGSSLDGHMGKRVKAAAELLLSNNMVYFMGSDAHSPRSRTPDLTKAVELLRHVVTADRAQAILATNPAELLAGREVDLIEVEKIRRPRKSNSLIDRISKFFE